MTPIITWKISQLDRNAADGGVTTAHWRVEAVDGDHSASAYGTAGFTPDATAAGFKPYDTLTEADVLGWVWGSVDKDAAEASLLQQIEAQKAPVTLTGTPW
jgi:hypothetical protein